MSSASQDPQVASVIGKYDRSRQNLIPILQDVQALCGYLPSSAMDQVAEYLELSVHAVYGVATFYSQFRLQPPGKRNVKVCEGTACHVRGSAAILDALARRLGISPGETTKDRKFSLDRVMCVGSCALAPAVVVDDEVHGRVTEAQVGRLLKENS